MQTDAHLRRAVRYVVRNPIRAGLSSRPEQWRWTSHHATVGRAAAGFVAVDALLACFADDRAEALRRYRLMVEMLEEPPPARHPLVAGDDVFVVERLSCVPRDPEFTRAMVRPPRPTLDDLVGSTDDRERIVTAHIGHGYSLREIASHLGCSVTTVHQIERDQLTVHADRGSSMTSKPVAMLLADLGLTKTHSRPYTSTDNPYSEAQFKTLKYRPGFPKRFDSIEHARAFCREFFDWYNHQHRHSGIGLMTPAAVHHSQARRLHADRERVLAAAYTARPERFVRGTPKPPDLPTAVWINKPTTQEVAH